MYVVLPRLTKSATEKNKGDELAVIKKKENEKKIKELKQYISYMKNSNFWEKLTRWGTSFETFHYEIDLDWDEVVSDEGVVVPDAIITSELEKHNYTDPVEKNLWYHFGFRDMSLTEATERVKKYAKQVKLYENLIKDLENENKDLKKKHVKFKTITLLKDTKQLDEAITIRHEEIDVDTDIKNYEFAISMWVFLYTQSSVSNKYSNIIDYGGNLNLTRRHKNYSF